MSQVEALMLGIVLGTVARHVFEIGEPKKNTVPLTRVEKYHGCDI